MSSGIQQEVSASTINDEQSRKIMSKALVKYSDMPTEMGQESVEIVTMALDKYQNNKNYEAAAQLIKNTMDKKFGPTW
eukprot:CAMPEP_0194406782 /NCGR_PEP_ID=MMETSP0176-20130528/4882_1 /TAXON_ID=216777 /ORGANISM="Proboscia alata, Strain PI-D3" /LENGTH=77 /DNA_ID=CAMNT_0039206101 /DNA_START=8 /DNA_END=238 /DNA_ORIENTATION=+